ncbi:MAG: hypothetical protein H7Z19_06975, partial [Chitinophagaceae bacterium]|nr:hypothetical protein [Rubrivivax sp.]
MLLPAAVDSRALQAGRPWPMGATVDADECGAGINFAVFSAHATQMSLCLFDST